MITAAPLAVLKVARNCCRPSCPRARAHRRPASPPFPGGGLVAGARAVGPDHLHPRARSTLCSGAGAALAAGVLTGGKLASAVPPRGVAGGTTGRPHLGPQVRAWTPVRVALHVPCLPTAPEEKARHTAPALRQALGCTGWWHHSQPSIKHPLSPP